MANPIDQREKPVLKELLEASKAAERLIFCSFRDRSPRWKTVHEHLVPTGPGH